MGDSSKLQAYKVGYHASEYKNASLPYEKSPTGGPDPGRQANEAGKGRQVDAVYTALPNPDLPIYKRFIGPTRQIVNDYDILPKLERGLDQISDEQSVAATDWDHPEAGGVECHHIMDRWGVDGTGSSYQFYFNSAEHKNAAGNPKANGTVEWVHVGLRSPTPSLIKSAVDTYALPRLEDGIDRLVDGLLRRMFSSEEKTFAAGYYLQPGVIRYDGEVPLQDVPDRPCTFVNFPYLCLEDPTRLEALSEQPDPEKRKFPVRSLLQSRYRLQLTYRKDGKQSVSTLSNEQVNACIQPTVAHLRSSISAAKCTKIVHIHQLWCLSLSGDTVVTCAPIEGETLHGQVISVNKINQNEPTVNIVLDYKGRLKRYRYQRSQCDSWFRLLNKHRQILLSKGLFGDEGVPKEQFNLFFQDETTKETEVTDLNWLEVLEKSTSSNLEITIRPKTPGIGLAGATALSQTSQNHQISKPNQQVVADPLFPAVNKETNKSSEIRHLNQFERKAINTDQEETSQVCLKSGADIALDSPSNPSPEEFANSLDSDKRPIIPFFQWRLRKTTKPGAESTRVGRSRIVLNRISSNLFERYRELFYDGDVAANELDSSILTRMSKMGGWTLEQFVKQTKDDALPSAPITSLIEETSAILNLFVPNVIDRNTQQNPLCPLPQDRAFNPIDTQSSPPGKSNLRESSSNPGGGPATENLVAAKVQDSSRKPVTATTGVNTKTEHKTVHPGIENHTTLKLFREAFGEVIMILKMAPIPEEVLQEIIERLRVIHKDAFSLHQGVRSLSGMQEHDNDPEFGGPAILQRAITEAFIRLVYMYFGLRQCLWTRNKDEIGLKPKLYKWALNHGKICAEKLLEAKNDLIAEAGELEKEPPYGPMVTPEAVIVMLLDRLSQNVHGVGTFDLGDIYGRVIEKLAADVEFNPTRSLLFEINKTSEELDIVRDVFKQQERVLLLYRTSLDPATFTKGKAGIERETKFPCEDRSISAVLKTVRENISDFDELRNRISQLRTQNVQLVETQQDENNKAILVFTVVTILFLPMSFVTGYFGMNLQDIADTKSGTGHFWAVAVPLTSAIAIPCLVLAFWGPIVRFWHRLLQKKSGQEVTWG
ncbi:hypothetical protein AYL99_03355 [Fonsecaea erecta]|uniref:Uncharacterized protein n=1 Tax=Fonsecaea erecta TaxID=1367422 RepID=A0A178ZMW0_9EURO|nr:hypothetical protein AYL99_03355 [Fonsecaea erecta]OAP61154.1 hypothetical protein AYL99_03355 [Fonsecaea erecta]